jgi:succinyl-CoA synthetase beta subunit
MWKTIARASKRFYSLQEAQAKSLMRELGVTVQKGRSAATPAEAFDVASSLTGQLVVKAQVQAGGRGKGSLSSGLKGGVHLTDSAAEVRRLSEQMIGFNITTHQTLPGGVPVKSVLVLEAIDIDKQLYLALLLDRAYGGPVFVASRHGGVEIEDTVKTDPSAVFVHPVPLRPELLDEDASAVAQGLGLEGDLKSQAIEQLKRLYKLFVDKDATQVEINPWAITPTQKLVCVDAKINIDDSALFRQPDIKAFKTEAENSFEADAMEVRAEKAGLSYVSLDGSIGCLVNGAGLAMATMDLVKLHGGSPANFLDVGGGANVKQVTEAFRILNAHPKVKAVLVNIFGGIMRCDVLAEGLITAAREAKMQHPLVVRLEGTNADLGRQLIRQAGAGWNLHLAEDQETAAQLAIQLAK